MDEGATLRLSRDWIVLARVRGLKSEGQSHDAAGALGGLEMSRDAASQELPRYGAASDRRGTERTPLLTSAASRPDVSSHAGA